MKPTFGPTQKTKLERTPPGARLVRWPATRTPLGGASDRSEGNDDARVPGSMSQGSLRRLTRAILAIGFGSAIAIYLIAGSPPANPLGYDPLDTKKYLHDLEVYGGKANVLAAQFREWFGELWQGKTLAFTVGVLTVLLVLAVRFFATLPPSADTGETLDPANSDRGDS